MTKAARLIGEFEERNIHIELDGERLVVNGPADNRHRRSGRREQAEIIRALRGWRIIDVTVEVAHGRLWLSTVERACGIPLAPGQRIAPTAVGSAIAWLIAAERKH